MSAQWWSFAPLTVVVAVWAVLSLRAWRRRALRRRRAVPLIEAALEAHVAVGSLSGVAPSDITAHVLLVLEEDGGVTISGTGCDSLRAFMLASASAACALEEWRAHDHDHGGGS